MCGAYTPFPDNCIWTSSASESWMPNCRSCATSSHARAQCQRRAHLRNGLPGRLARYPSEPCRVGVQRQSSAGVEVLKSFVVRVMRGRSRETRRCTARSGRGVTTRPPAHRGPPVRGPAVRSRIPAAVIVAGMPMASRWTSPSTFKVAAVLLRARRASRCRTPITAVRGAVPHLVECRADATRGDDRRPDGNGAHAAT